MTLIEWTDRTINPLIGCTKISAGCKNCYAATASRSGRLRQFKQYQGVVDNHRNWTGQINFAPDQLLKLAQIRKPTRVFMPSMSDIFHHAVKLEWLDQIFSAIEANPLATVQILTKRPGRMLEYFRDKLPLENLWLGVSIENQAAVESRARHLYSLHNAGWKTFYSVEPLLEEVELYLNHEMVDWVIVGGESGKDARSCDVDWIRSIVNQCDRSQVPVFVKQLGKCSLQSGQTIPSKDRKGGNIADFPIDLRRRNLPI
jgi:protein gp37